MHPYILKNTTFQPSSLLPSPIQDGLYETLLIRNKQPLLLADHMARFRHSVQVLGLPSKNVPFSNLKELLSEFIDKNSIDDGAINWNLIGDDFYVRSRDFTLAKTVTVKLQKDPFIRSTMSEHKLLSLPHYAWSKKHLVPGHDFLFHSKEGELFETSMANVYFVKGTTLFTPTSRYILPGILRGWLLTHQSELNIKVQEKRIFIDDLATFDGAFLTNSLRGFYKMNLAEASHFSDTALHHLTFFDEQFRRRWNI